MDNNGKISKMLPIGFIAFLVMGYGFRLIFETSLRAIDHMYIAAGALSLLLFMISFSEVQSYERSGHAQKISSLEMVVSCIGILEIVVLFMAGILLLVMPINIEGMPADVSDRINRIMSYLFALDIALIIYTLIAINIWSKRIVEEGYLVLLGSKALYPGEKYRLWPFKTYRDRVIKAEFSVKTETIQVKCKNDTIPVKAASSMKIDLDEARKRGITAIDLNKLAEEALNSFVSMLERQASSINVSELLKGNLKAENLDITGIPVIWEGKVQATTA